MAKEKGAQSAEAKKDDEIGVVEEMYWQLATEDI